MLPVGPLLVENIYSPWREHIEERPSARPPDLDDYFTDAARTFAVIFFHAASSGAAAAAIFILRMVQPCGEKLHVDSLVVIHRVLISSSIIISTG